MPTIDELERMNDSDFNCAIAELAGWKFVLHSARNRPDYANDLNAAWALGDGDQMLEVAGGSGRPGSECEGHCADDRPFADVYTRRHVQPARALSTAFAAWLDAQYPDA